MARGGELLDRVEPALVGEVPEHAGAPEDDVSAPDLLHALTQLCQPVPGRGPEHNQHIVGVLLDGLRCGAARRSTLPG